MSVCETSDVMMLHRCRTFIFVVVTVPLLFPAPSGGRHAIRSFAVLRHTGEVGRVAVLSFETLVVTPLAFFILLCLVIYLSRCPPEIGKTGQNRKFILLLFDFFVAPRPSRARSFEKVEGVEVAK
jgi:hypothetical protein